MDYFRPVGFAELVWKTETGYISSQLRLSGPVLNENKFQMTGTNRGSITPDCYCTVVNWAGCGAAQFIKWISFFFWVGGGCGISGKS